MPRIPYIGTQEVLGHLLSEDGDWIIHLDVQRIQNIYQLLLL